MGAVLWSFFPLISLLLLSDAWQAQADSHGEWLSETRRLYRQSYGGGGDLAAGCSECRENESSGVDFKRLETSFLSVVNNSTETLGRRVMNGESLLVHVVSCKFTQYMGTGVGLVHTIIHHECNTTYTY